MSSAKFIDDAVTAHNEYRQRHQVAPLKHNQDLSAFAQKWADHLASSGAFQHNPNRDFKGNVLGENIAMKWSSGGEDYNGYEPVEQWYSEVSKYSFSAGSGPGTGHFTQVVWKDSSEVGMGRAQARDGKWIIVGNYLPAGNMMGRYKENVFPSKDGNTALVGGATQGNDRAGGKAPQRVPHQQEPQPTTTGGSNTKWDSETTSRNVTREVREESRGGPGGYKKTVVTETTIGPDGQRHTVTRETVSSDNKKGFDDDFDSRFKSMGFRDDA